MKLRTLAEPVGNLDSFDVGRRHIERVAVRSDDLAKRVVRLASTVGEIGIRFESELRLRDGDVLYADDERVVAVSVGADDVLVIRPRSVHQALEVAHALGNRHLPARFEGDTMILRYDGLVEELLAEMHVPYEREARVLPEAFRHAHAPHTHE